MSISLNILLFTLLSTPAIAGPKWQTAKPQPLKTDSVTRDYLGKNFHVQSSFKNSKTGESILFGQIGLCEPTGCTAAIAISKKDSWKLITARDHMKWEFIRSASDQKIFVAILESQVEAPATDLPIIVSKDSGQTFKLMAEIPKPNYMMYLHALYLDDKGHGHLHILSDDDDDEASANGLYDFEFRNWGEKWRKVGFIPDKLENNPTFTSEIAVPFTKALGLQK